MKTYKKKFYKRWWIGNFISSTCMIIIISLSLFLEKPEFLLLILPLVAIGYFFDIKCPNCKAKINTGGGSRGWDNINYCQKCAFDLNTEFEE